MTRKYSPGFLAEVARLDRIHRDSTTPSPTDIGLRQFFDFESRGIQPERPDPYFTHLLNGKRWWEWTINEYAVIYLTEEWPGWAAIEEDFADDPRGLRQIEARCRRVTVNST